MDLMRLSVKRETLISTDLFTQAATETRVQAFWSQETLHEALPQRNTVQHLRVALAYKARAWHRFERNGEECSAILSSPKQAKGLDIRIHVRRKDTYNVSYSDEVAAISGGNGVPLTARVTEHGRTMYPDLVADLCNVEALIMFGEAHYFDNDLRRLVQALLSKVTMALWPGVSLVLDQTAHAAIAAVQTLLGTVEQGEVLCRLLSLDNTPANRQALANELAERLTVEGEELLELLRLTDPNLKRCRVVWEELLERVKRAEALLEVEIPCWDTLAECEILLEQLESERDLAA